MSKKRFLKWSDNEKRLINAELDLLTTSWHFRSLLPAKEIQLLSRN